MLRLLPLLVCPALAVPLISGCTAVSEPTVEIMPRGSFTVALSELEGALPLGSLAGEVVLAGKQAIVITHLDPEGRQVAGHDPVNLALTPGLTLCESHVPLPEAHCLAVEPGDHLLLVGVGDEFSLLPFQAVSPSDILRIELLQPNEAELLPGTWVQVDVVGVTRDGTHVDGVHPRFAVGEDLQLGYFAYRFDPDAPVRTLTVEALGRRMQTTFRGLN